MNRVASSNALQIRLRSNERPVIVEVWAPWCGPCRTMAPALERAGEAYSGRVDVWKLNADEQSDMVRALGVRGIPTLIVFQGDKEIARRTGAQSSTELTKLFDAALSGAAPARSHTALSERLLRTFAGISVLAIGGVTGPSLPLIALGGAITFSAVHDRCPLWQAISPRLARLARQLTG